MIPSDGRPASDQDEKPRKTGLRSARRYDLILGGYTIVAALYLLAQSFLWRKMGMTASEFVVTTQVVIASIAVPQALTHVVRGLLVLKNGDGLRKALGDLGIALGCVVMLGVALTL